MMRETEILGRNIRFARKQANLSQGDVANALGLASHSAVSAMESGSRRISASELVRLSEIFETPMDWFFDPAAGKEDFVVLASAQDKPRGLREALLEAQRYFDNYVMLRDLLASTPSR